MQRQSYEKRLNLVDIIYWKALSHPWIVRGYIFGTDLPGIEAEVNRWVELKEKQLGASDHTEISCTTLVRDITCSEFEDHEIAEAIRGLENIRNDLATADSAASSFSLEDLAAEHVLAEMSLNYVTQ